MCERPHVHLRRTRVRTCTCQCPPCASVRATTKTGQQWEPKQCQAATLCSLITKRRLHWLAYKGPFFDPVAVSKRQKPSDNVSLEEMLQVEFGSCQMHPSVSLARFSEVSYPYSSGVGLMWNLWQGHPVLSFGTPACRSMLLTLGLNDRLNEAGVTAPWIGHYSSVAKS